MFFLLIVIALQIPTVQNFAKNKAVAYLENKIKTKVTVNKIEIGLPKKIILEGVYFEDQNKDTLLSGKKLAVNISLFKLLDNILEINSVELDGVSVNLNRNKQAVFNFDYIVKAFSSPVKKTDNSAPMRILIDKINFDNIKFKYKDAISNNDIQLKLNHFDTRIKTFDLDKMNFEIPKINVDGLNLFFKQGLIFNKINTVENKNANAKTNFNLNFGEIDLSKILIAYQDENSKINTKIDLQKMFLSLNKFDYNNQLIDIKNIDLNGLKSDLILGKVLKITETVQNTPTPPNNWKINAEHADLKNLNFKFDDENSIAIPQGIDYKHLNLQNLNLSSENLVYNSKNIKGKIIDFSANEKSGLIIQKLKTDFYYDDKGAFLKNLYLKTPQTLLKNQLVVNYPDLKNIENNLGQIYINANFTKSKLGFKDILIFAPNLKNTNPFKNNSNAILVLDTKIKGKLENLEIPNFEIAGIGTTKLSFSGKIIGLPDASNAFYDLKIKNLVSSKTDIFNFIPKGTIPTNIELPENLILNGFFKGTVNNFKTDLNLKSSFGNAKILANLNQKIKNNEQYQANVDFDNFDLGQLIKNKSLGKISLIAKVKGSSFNPKVANAIISGAISKAEYNRYSYNNIALNGKIKNGFVDLNLDSKDKNLTFDLVANASLKGENPSGKLKLNIDIADLYKLNFYNSPLRLKGNLEADIQSANLDYLNGTISANHFLIANEKEQFPLDSINIVAIADDKRKSLVLKSQFLNANIDGNYKLSQVGDAITNSISNYYNLNIKKVKVDKQQFAFGIQVKDNPILFKLIPDLKSLEPISISGKYNSVNDSIVVNGSISKVVYGGNTISNAIIKIETKDKALIYNAFFDNIQNSQFLLPHTSVSGKVENDKVDYTLQIKDLKDKERYLIVGTLKNDNQSTLIKLDDKNLVLNYEKWQLSPENLIQIDANSLFINAFNLSKSGNSLSVQSQSNQKNAPVNVDFKNFEIETLTNIAQKSDWQIGGKINGNALFKNIEKSPIFTSELKIEDFSFQKDTVGTININVNNEKLATYNAKIGIIGNGNKVDLDGNYYLNNNGLDFTLNIEKLNVKSIQGFTFGNLTESTGFLNGNYTISGTTEKPKIIGTLKFNEVGFKVKTLNAKFKSMNDKIDFSENKIVFSNFIIKDEKDNNLSINGSLDSQNFSNLGFNLKVDAINFNAINSKEKDNAVYYGSLFLDNHLKINGNVDNPIVEGNVKINKDTKFTIVLPQSDPSIADREGIVEFIDQDQPQLFTIIDDKEIIKTEIKGINASVNIEIDKQAELSLIIDKANGDYLKLKGEAQLNGGIDASGKTTLTGRYEFNEGTYEMNFNFIKRKFDIKPGSYILWTGEPTTADVKITAVYKTQTAPIDLLDDQLGSISMEARNRYKQRIPFETELKMKGELMKPEISFNIILPENNDVSSEISSATQAKLAQLREQPGELNKQVFALLLLNRFIGENPFSSEAGGASAAGLARASASKVLSQQLNNLAGDLINGVDLNFDLESSDDYTSGQKENKTDLNVGISKKLLNDRLKVSVGSSFGLEGPKQENKSTNNIAGDISADYQLTKDGRYKIRAYRKNQYQVALQGEVIETGVAFIITIDYNKFRELFQKSKSSKK